MTRKSVLTGAMLWASAILASATIGAPDRLSLIVLPSLAAIALLFAGQGTRAHDSRSRAPSC